MCGWITSVWSGKVGGAKGSSQAVVNPQISSVDLLPYNLNFRSETDGGKTHKFRRNPMIDSLTHNARLNNGTLISHESFSCGFSFADSL